jgi:hypothetical protein
MKTVQWGILLFSVRIFKKFVEMFIGKNSKNKIIMRLQRFAKVYNPTYTRSRDQEVWDQTQPRPHDRETSLQQSRRGG